jgi:hypothetical protein
MSRSEMRLPYNSRVNQKLMGIKRVKRSRPFKGKIAIVGAIVGATDYGPP